MEKILVPVDFSGNSLNAVKVAEAVAVRTKAEVTLLHVIEYPYSSKFSSTVDLIYQDELLEQYLKRLKEKSGAELKKLTVPLRDKGVSVKTDVCVGKLFKETEKYIREQNISLLVCGIRGEEAESDLGSNAEKFVRRMDVPVITVDTVPRDFEVNKVLFASLFTPEERPLFLKAREIASSLKAQLTAVRINSPASYLSTPEKETLIRQLMEEYEPNPEIEVYPDVSEEEGIIRFASEVNADLIIIGTHGREGILHFFRGSIAEDLAGISQRPVMTLRIK